MKDSGQMQQKYLLESVLEVLNILTQRRPDLNRAIIPILVDAKELLAKSNLSDHDLEWCAR